MPSSCRTCAISVFFAVALPGATEASLFPDDRLTEFDFLLLGLTVKPEPPSQVVPRNTATGIRIELAFTDVNADASGLLALLPTGLEVVAELVGPGIDAPIELRGPPGEFLPIPPLVSKGVYLVRDIRLEKNGTTFLRASPDSATVEVIERILITQVTTRPLTLEEIRQKGILFGDDSFSGFNFTLALRLDSRPVTIDFPVVFDSNDIPVPIRPSAGLDLEGSDVPLVNTGLVPVMLKLDIPGEQQAQILPLLPDVRIPGLIVIPGDVGFLNQFFSAILLVSNGAPLASALSVRDLSAEIELPPGDGQGPPLVVAETQSGGQVFVLPMRGLGRDGEPETADDTGTFAPGEQGQAEFLLEGRKEGFHEIAFDIRGMLDGLPIGPVPLTGTARGGVLVRNPTFNLTFTAPATVRAGEQFSLFVSVTNVSTTPANLVTVRLDPTRISGATLLSGPTEPIATLVANDTEVLEFRFVSSVTGQVTASYLNVEEGTGNLLFRLGVGERGVPLSPDTIVLPKSVEELPAAVVAAALRVLGQAWSVATAPNGTLPEGVARVSKQGVLDRATEIAEAGFRVQLGEPISLALESLAFSWASTGDKGFEQILRETSAGKAFFESLGAALATGGGVADFQRDLSRNVSGLSSHVLLGVGSGNGAAALDWTISDAAGRVLDPEALGTLANAAFLPLTQPAEPGRGVALLTRLGSSLYEWRFASTASQSIDLAVSLPRSDGSIGFHVFSGVSLEENESGKLTLDLLQGNPVLTLRIDRDGDGVFEDSVVESSQEILTTSPPSLLAATVIGPETLTGADPWGRIVALLFDREMRETEVLDVSSYQVEENAVLSSSLQLSRRIAFVFLESPVSDFVERTIGVSGLFDTRGRSLPSSLATIASRLEDPGAVVTGRVLNADGTPVAGAEVLYINSVSGNVIGISQKRVDELGRYQFDYVRKSPIGPFSMRARDPVTGSVQELTTTVAFDGERVVVDLVLLGRGGVTGIVRDSSGNPIPNAKVLVTSEVDASSFALSESDGDGRYVATGIVVGPLTVKAVHGTTSGLASGNLPRAGTFTTVDVNVNLTLGTVTGGVFELAQDIQMPVRDIEVYYLIPTSGGREFVAATTRTDASGAYGFVEVPVPSGDFRILAIDRVRSRQASNRGSFVPGQTLLSGFDVFFIADEFGAVEVTVHDPSGTPVSLGEALVTVSGRELLTNAAGKATFEDLPPGPYNVSARAAGSSRSVFASTTVTANATTHVSLQIPGTGRLVVTLLDETGARLPTYPVIRNIGSPCSGEQVLTDPELGVAVFEDVPIGNVTVKSIRGADVAAASTYIQRAGDEKAVILRFAGFGTITGTVVEQNNAPYLGASVVLASKRLVSSLCDFVNDGAAQQVRTGIDGTFTFGNVPLGAFTVSASEPTFYPLPVSVTDVLRGSVNVPLKLTTTIAGELSGTVFLPDGVTRAGSGVRLTVSGGGRPDVTVSTNAQGDYGFAPIFPQGRYILTASDPATGNLARETIFLLEDQDLVRNPRLLGRSSVEVTVLKGDGTPIDEAFVELKGAAFPFDVAAGNITPFDSGRVVFPRISEGSFTVTASDRFSRGGRASGVVTGDGVLARVTVNLSVTGRVTGKFEAPNGIDPIGNAAVVLRQGSTGRLLGSTATSNMPGEIGTFAFAFVPAGPFLATATDPLTGRIGEAAGTIETEGEVVPLTIRALGLGKLSGMVTSGSVGVASASVEITSSTGLSSAIANLKATATAGAGGEFTFDGIPVGSFTIKATLPGSAPLTGSVTGNITEDGQAIEDLEVALEPSGAIGGNVLRADEVEAVPGASLELRPSKGILRGQANAAGTYRFDFVPTGAFTLEAEEPGGPDAGIASGNLAEGEELVANVVLNGTGTVEGTAFDSNGGILTSGRVRLTRRPPFARDETATVSSDGTFTIFGVPVGDYNLSLSVDGSPLHGTATGRIEFDTHVDTPTIQLAPATSVTGSVAKPDGTGGTVPAGNVVVTLSGGNIFLSTLTAANGAFAIGGVPEGAFTLKAQDPLTAGIATASIAIDLPELPPFDPEDVGTLVLDLEPIRVNTVTPGAGATLVPPDSNVVLTFSDPFAQAEVPGRFIVRSGGVNIPGTATVSGDGLSLTFDPTLYLPPSAAIEVFVSKDLADTFGRKLGSDFNSSFATGAAVVTARVTNVGAPAAGADVTLTSSSGSLSAVTGVDGRFRFQDVAPGTITVVATSAGLTGSRVVDVPAAVGVVDIGDLPLRQVSSIAGQVIEFGGAPSGAGLEVRVSQGSDVVAFTTTAPDGGYVVTNVPLGSFLLDVTNPANGDRGRRLGDLEIGGLQDFDVQMTGVGTVDVVVRDGNAALLQGVSVTLTRTEFGLAVRSGTTGANGTASFADVLAVSTEISASDPVTSASASTTITPAPADTTIVDLVLETPASIEGTVLAPGGTSVVSGAVVRVYRDSGNFLKGETVTGADGRYQVGNLIPSQSPYRVDVLVNGMLRARRRGIVVPAGGGSATVDIELVGVGVVTGRALPPSGETLSSGVTVTLTSLAPDVGGIRTTTTSAASMGQYSFAEVPVGDFRVTARDNFQGFLGAENAAVTADAETVTVDIQLEDNAFTFFTGGEVLDDGNGTRYRIAQTGAMVEGVDNLFDFFTRGLNLDVTVAGATTRFAGDPIGTREDSNRELSTAVEAIGDLNVQRKMFVPPDGYFARYLEIFENTGTETIELSAAVVSDVNSSSGSPLVVDSFDGDDLVDAGERWLVVDDANDADPHQPSVGSIPAATFVLAGSPPGPAAVELESVGVDGRLSVSYDFSIPPGGHAVLLHFLSQQTSRAAARAAAERLVELPPEALSGLEGEEIATIRNFTVPADGVSASAPLPPLDGRVSGSILASDGVTKVGSATGAFTFPVNLQSDHILFRRVWLVNASSGLFRFAANPLGGVFDPRTIPRVGFTLETSSSLFGQTRQVHVDSDFTGSTLLSDAPTVTRTASSELGFGNTLDKAFDGNPATYWSPGDSDALRTIEFVAAVPARVLEIEVAPHTSSELDQVVVSLFDAAGGVIESQTAAFPNGNDSLSLSFAASEAPTRILADFDGETVHIAEMSVRGEAATEIGHALRDLVFAGTASVDVSVAKFDGTPVASSITFTASGGERSATTDSSGRLFFAPVPETATPMTVFARPNATDLRFLSASEVVDLVSDETAVVNLVLPQTTTVSGTLFDGDGATIPSYSVTLVGDSGPGEDQTLSKNTDGNGVFSFVAVPSGSYRLRVIRNSSTIDVPVTVSAPTPLVRDIHLPVFGQVGVTVRFEPGAPTDVAEGARVDLIDSLGRSYLSQITNASGQTPQQFTNVPGGPFTLLVRHPVNFASVTANTSYAVTATGENVAAVVVIPAFGTVNGKIFFGDGTTVASGAKVEISGPDISFPQATAGVNGYTFSNVRGHRDFTVLARHPGQNRGHITSQAQDRLDANGETAIVDLVLPKTSTVSVTVEEEDGSDIEGSEVSILDSFSTEFRLEGTTASNGTFSIPFVPFGPFTVRARFAGAFLGEASGAVTVHGDTLSVTITRPSDATVEGVVTAGDGETPIENAPVTLLNEDETEILASTATDAEGTYRFVGEVAPGTTAVVQAHFPGDQSLSAETTVSATSPGETLTANLEIPVTVVKGRVLESDGTTEVPGATVSIHTAGTHDVQFATVEADGSFLHFGLPEATYEIVAEDAFGLVGRAEGEIVDFSLVRDVLLPEHGTVEALPLPSGPSVYLTNANVFRPRGAPPDAGGRYRFERVAFGSFSVVSDDFALPSQGVGELSASETFVEVDLEVPETGTVSGEVLDSNGDALAANEDTFLTLEGRKRETGDSESSGYYQVSPLNFDGSAFSDPQIPEGEVTVVAQNFLLGQAGIATGTLNASVGLQLSPQLGTAVMFRYQPEPSAAELHEVDADGVVLGAFDTVFFGDVSFGRVRVNGKGYPFLSAGTLQGSEVVLGPVRVSGVHHTRKVLVPAGAPYARIVDVFENPNGIPMEVSVSFESWLSVPGSYTEVSGSWVAGSNGDGTAVAWVYAGAEGTPLVPDRTGRDELRMTEEWRRIPIPAFGSVVLVHFGVQAPDLATAIARASSLSTPIPGVLNFEP